MKIILDTNFLLIPGQFGVDIFDEISRICIFPYKISILDKTLDEIQSIIEKGNGKDKTAAKIALSLIKHKDLNIITTKDERIVDDILVDMANKDIIVATNDKGLKNRLMSKCRIIILKSKKHLSFWRT